MSEKYGSLAESRHLTEVHLFKKRLKFKCKKARTPNQHMSWLEQVILPTTENLEPCYLAPGAAWCTATPSPQTRSGEFNNNGRRRITYFDSTSIFELINSVPFFGLFTVGFTNVSLFVFTVYVVLQTKLVN